MSYDEWKLRSPDDDRELQEGRQWMECNYPNCDGGYATGYCGDSCRAKHEALMTRLRIENGRP